MRNLPILLIIFFVAGCEEKITYDLEDFQKMNGYWQITNVIYPNGEKKKYLGSPAIEYIEVSGAKGFKKKLYPRLDGVYETSNDALPFRVVKKSGKGYFISYSDAENGWQEALNYMTDDFFSLKNEDGLIFCYSRQKKIKSILDAEKTE